MGLDLAGRRPHDQDEPPRDGFGRQDGLIGGVEPVALAADPPLRRFDLLRAQAGGGQGRPPVPLPDTDDDVAAVQVVVVVRERADRPQHLGAGGMRIPGRLELHPLGLHAAAVEEAVEVDGEDRAHGGSIASRQDDRSGADGGPAPVSQASRPHGTGSPVPAAQAVRASIIPAKPEDVH